LKTISVREYADRYFDRVEGLGESASVLETEPSDICLPRRKPVTHKYSYGRALIVSGARGYSGAPVLAANAAERSGAGLTHLMVPESIYIPAAVGCDGAVVTPLPANARGQLAAAALPEILPQLERASACAVGPGLGPGEDTKVLTDSIVRHSVCPLLLDADALTACGNSPELLDACCGPLVLTPHEGEFRRLGGDLSEGRLVGALRFTREHPGVILILKGYGTLVCRGGEAVVNPTGCPAMAKGGAGDVLSGILCALLAQGFEAWSAALYAVWLHGLAGDLAAQEQGEYSLTPSDLIRFLPRAFRTAQK